MLLSKKSIPNKSAALIAVLVCALFPELVFAMPWDGPLAEFTSNLSGQTARAIATIVFVVIGLLISFGEVVGILGTVLRVSFGLSFALMATTWIGFFIG